MDKLAGLKRLATVTLVAVGIALAVLAPNQTEAASGHGFGHPGGGHPGRGVVHQGFVGHHGFDGHHGFHRHGHSRVLFFGYPYYGYYPPAYGYEVPRYWYYCPSYGDYYPNVASCPEAWVPVPAS